MHMLRLISLPILCTLLALSPALRAIEPVPSRLSDEAFWKLVTETSEPDGVFLSENFVSNELGYQYVITPALKRIQSGGAYVGVGPEQNFTYVAAFRPSIAFIVDIRRQNLIEHLLYKAIFELSSDRREFISRLFARKSSLSLRADASARELFTALAITKEDPEFLRETLLAIKDLLQKKHGFGLSKEDEASLEHVYQEFAGRGADVRYSISNPALIAGFPVDLPERNQVQALVSGIQFPSYATVMTATDAEGRTWNFLATEENYQAVREMQRNNLIVPVVGDFAGPKALRAVGRYLKEHESIVSVFYVSNVEQYLTAASTFRTFYSNVAALPIDSSSTFIRSIQGPGTQPGVAQSSISPMQTIIEAVIEGRAQSVYDLIQPPN
jgi:hypothetical protein